VFINLLKFLQNYLIKINHLLYISNGNTNFLTFKMSCLLHLTFLSICS